MEFVRADPAADWYGRVYRIAFTVARRRFRFDTADAEDVAQEMALRVLTRIEVRGVNPAWVHRGAMFLCIDLQRTRTSERGALETLLRQRVRQTMEPRTERERDLYRALGRLSPGCQSLIRQYFLEGLTWREIDEQLDCGRRHGQYATGKCVAELKRLVGAWQ